MKSLIAILFVMNCNYSFAQISEMRGKVLDISTKYSAIKKPIPFATIKVYYRATLIQQTVSDSLGNYTLKNLLDNYRMSVEAKGYEKEDDIFSITDKSKIAVSDIYLKKK